MMPFTRPRPFTWPRPLTMPRRTSNPAGRGAGGPRGPGAGFWGAARGGVSGGAGGPVWRCAPWCDLGLGGGLDLHRRFALRRRRRLCRSEEADDRHLDEAGLRGGDPRGVPAVDDGWGRGL